MVETENKVIQCRRDTAANWASNNPVPKAGEWCFETDTGVTKIGDGATNYNSLAAVGKTDATKAELDKLHNLSTTKTELGYVHGVTSAIQTQLNAKFAKADIQTSFGETLSDEKVASEKLVKNSLDAKQDGITVANNSMLKASVLSAMNIVGENNSGRRYDEPKTLAKVISAAHSTFDRSKFTVVGSPNITDDGIASGFSSGDYISSYSPSDWGDSWEIDIHFVTGDNVSTGQGIFQSSYNLSAMVNRVEIGQYSGNHLRYFITTDGVNWLGDANARTGLHSILPNTKYVLKFSYTGSAFIAYLSVNDGTFEKDIELTSSNNWTNIPSIQLGRQGNFAFNGTIDLKQFSITVDGVPVFSGNKTGIDTIKPDDYTVVGTPTISDDGIASGFSNYSTYLDTNITPDFSKAWELNIRYKNSNSGDGSGRIVGLNGHYNEANILRLNGVGSSQYGISYLAKLNDNTTVNIGTSWQTGLDCDVWYDIKIKYDLAKYYLYYKKATDNNYILVNSIENASYINNTNNIVLGGINYNAIPYGSIDLNSFKIYVDGKLVYQPCLKIPYTLAANDKKFINPIYENRAKDMAEQFGVAPYYILDEDNGNFAMPYGSVEEKVAPKIVVGHYEDGTSAWEQYLDRTMIQRGTMVADTDVTFPCSDEYADTNFTLSCPFSAKTTSGFTPSASGTYIAVGKF